MAEGKNDLIIAQQANLIETAHWQTCINCDAWNHKAETCEHFGGIQPPAAVIVKGCPEWTREIPF